MKKILSLSIILLFSLISSSCDDNTPPEPGPVEINTVVELTVIDENQEIVPNTLVYLFEDPATTADGKNPSKAIESGTTNNLGVVTLSLKNISNPASAPTIYFTVLEKLISLQIRVLGSLAVTVSNQSPAILKKTLQVSNRFQDYPHGFIPTTLSSDLARTEYVRWKQLLIRSCDGGLRPIADPVNQSKVEAVGFGTILAAYADDQQTFDGLMRFYDSKRTTQANNMMSWLVTCDGIEDPGSATDGDIDVAYANIVAHVQWGGDYLNKAREILDIIKDHLIIDCMVDGMNTRVLAPGYSNGLWGGCGLTDIQYYTPAFFRVFAQASGDAIWEELAEDTYRILNASAHASTGLVPDWQTAEGSPGPQGRVGYYGYDACRVPWRLSLDYLWNGDSRSKEWCTKVSDWAYGIGPANIVDGYELNGTARGVNGLNSSFLGGFTVAMMCNDFNKVNEFSTVLRGLNDTYWFNLNTRVLYLFTLTGNFWEPEF